MSDPCRKSREELMSDLALVGRVLLATGAMRAYRGGDWHAGYLLRRWHPLSWPVALAAWWIGDFGSPDSPAFRLPGRHREMERRGEVEWF